MNRAAFLALAVTFVFSGAPAMAQGINQMQGNQQARINAGLADGSLSAKEAKKLQKKYDRINELEARMRASGGKLSRKERSKLSNELSELHRQISKQRWDGNNRVGGNPPGPKGGPGYGKNWKYNPPGKRGGPGSGWERRAGNPPGPAGGPGAGKNWKYNPPGKSGGPGRGWERRHH